ncbi:hypothetical protein HYFRA_00000499 [Hymenoscyphus fraxineus]|uniref:RING-type domain-containing protein n=1 Tax=Hymenoscyphus fraxineus TaxID=746836 RepID=A0A9N9L0Y2_9HELO|nr:hypothetical protein HYFRA_00000499 [Hymenoscyphus fraxineus]
MSTSNPTAAQVELIESLTQDEIPIKLRCAICSRLAVNAFRLPCCDQIICETCQSTLPSSCPVCEHTPVSAEDCKPNKALRTTIKIFLRTEEKKREVLRQKEVKDTPPATPLEPEPIPIETVAVTESIVDESKVLEPENTEAEPQVDGPLVNPVNEERTDQAQQDIPQASIEEIAPGQESTAEGDVENLGINAAEKADEDATEKGLDEEAKQGAAQAAGFGFDPSVAGGFPGMGMGGEMNPMMQQMLMMQNGMGAGFGNFPMMGMPGMNMDPMAMQAMLMNGGFGAGMNGMPMGMGMGMGGFNGGMGSGFNNGWNDQSSWSNDNFSNHPNGQGDYGNNFGSAHTGYNQTNNYGRPNQYNDYQNGYGPQGYRGRGRGRGGGYGRGGGFGHGSNEAFSQQLPQQFGSGQQAHGPISETGTVPTGPKADSVPAGNVDEFGREIRAKSGDQEDSSEKPTTVAGAEPNNDGNVVESAQATDGGPESYGNGSTEANEGSTMPIQTFDEAQAAAFQANGHNGYYDGYMNGSGYGASRGGFSHGFRGGRGGGFGAMQPPVKPVDVPINAPKGPKAMREGMPNTSIRGRPFSIAARGSSRNDASASASVAPEPSDKEQRDKSPSRERSRERSKSRERRRSRSGSRSRHHRRHRHRSNSRSEDERETEERRERRRERRRRREEEEGQRAADDAVDEAAEEKGERVNDDPSRSRSASPSDSRRSGHKSRRDRDKYRERDRESEHKSSSHKHRSSRRSHRDDRSRSRDRDHRERRHRHSRHQSEDAADKPTTTHDTEDIEPPVEADESVRRPSIISNGNNGIEIKGVSIKGASTRNKASLDEIKIPTGPRKDRILSAKEREKDRGSSSRNHDKDYHSSRHRDSERSGRDKDRDREREKEKTRSKGDTKSAPAPAAQDPHTMEREARNRERLLKESQRLAALTGGESRKRSRDDGDDAGTGRKGRRTGKSSRRGGAVVGDEEEARLARMEAEREGARWS